MRKDTCQARPNGRWYPIYQEEYGSRPGAMRREKQLKGWNRAKKEALIAGNRLLLKTL